MVATEKTPLRQVAFISSVVIKLREKYEKEKLVPQNLTAICRCLAESTTFCSEHEGILREIKAYNEPAPNDRLWALGEFTLPKSFTIVSQRTTEKFWNLPNPMGKAPRLFLETVRDFLKEKYK